MPKHMYCDIDLDWCTYYCPCGDYLCTDMRSDQSIRLWLEEHSSHTDGKVLEHTNDNGCRAWGGPVPDEVKKLPTQPPGM